MGVSRDTPVVFDLDGTLVESFDFDAQCYLEALRDVLGNVPFNECWQTYHHVTDAGIVNQIIRDHQIENGPRVFADVREVFGAKVGEYLQSGGPCQAMPGARELLQALRDEGFKVGVATGGWGHTARMKLEAAGFTVDACPLASSDDAPERTQIMAICRRRISGNAGDAVYFGDAEWDIAASAKLGWAFIGVGERLKGRCSPWIPNFLTRR